MADQQLIDLLKRGPITWNKWKQQHPEIRLNLSGANLSRANLSEADLSGADLLALT